MTVNRPKVLKLSIMDLADLRAVFEDARDDADGAGRYSDRSWR